MISVLLAQTEHQISNKPFEGLGPLGGEVVSFIVGAGEVPTNALGLFYTILSNIIGIMTVVAAIWFVFQFFTAAIQILTSSGDKTKMEEARNKITQAVIGLVIVVAAIFLISLIGSLLGLNILGPWNFVTDLWS
jgi:hypothetical protein